MEIFILRHGQAVQEAPRDRDRQLTVQGRQELRETLQRCQTELQSVEGLWASPFVRTQQTSDIACEFLPHRAGRNRHTSDLLTPCANPLELAGFLAQLNLQSVLLVSHQPLVGTFVDWLCGLETGRYRLGTSALAAIDTDIVGMGLAQLRWLKQPAA